MGDYWKNHPFRDCDKDKAPRGWRCSRVVGHDGPCAAHPTGLNRIWQWVRR